MPTYEFKDLKSGEIITHVMKMSELDKFKEKHPELERYITNTNTTIDPTRLGRVKIDSGFRDVLCRIAERTPGGGKLRDSIR